jgi:hypothetical protein
MEMEKAECREEKDTDEQTLALARLVVFANWQKEKGSEKEGKNEYFLVLPPRDHHQRQHEREKWYYIYRFKFESARGQRKEDKDKERNGGGEKAQANPKQSHVIEKKLNREKKE